jgi:hypothetical protein
LAYPLDLFQSYHIPPSVDNCPDIIKNYKLLFESFYYRSTPIIISTKPYKRLRQTAFSTKIICCYQLPIMPMTLKHTDLIGAAIVNQPPAASQTASKLVKIGAKVASQSKYIRFQMA